MSEGNFDPLAQLILWLNGPVCVSLEDSCYPLTPVTENKKGLFFCLFVLFCFLLSSKWLWQPSSSHCVPGMESQRNWAVLWAHVMVQGPIPRRALGNSSEKKAWLWVNRAVQFSSVTQSCPTLCDPMNRSTPGLPVHHQLPEFTQTYVHRGKTSRLPCLPLWY